MTAQTWLFEGRYVWYPLGIAAVLIAVALRIGWVQVRDSTKPNRKLFQFICLIAVFFALAIVLVGSYVVRPQPATTVDPQDLSTAENILLAALAIFIPILVNLWNTALKEIIEAVKSLQALADERPSPRTTGAAQMAISEYIAVRGMGKWFQPFFYASLGMTIALIVWIMHAHGTFGGQVDLSAGPILRLMSELFVLYFMTLMAAHIVLVLPTASKLQALSVEILLPEADEGVLMTRSPWNLKRFFIAAVFAATIFAVTFAVGGAITATLGPGTSGIFTIIITTMLIIAGAEIIGTKLVFTVIVTLFSVLAIPTTLFGPPGPLKIGIGLATGLVYDIVWELFGRRRRIALPVAAAISTAVSIVLIFTVMRYVGHERTAYMQKMLKYFVPVYVILGALGGWLGEWLYDRTLSRLGVVKQLKGNDAAGPRP